MYSTPFLYFFCVDIFFFYEFRYCLINNQLNCQHLFAPFRGFCWFRNCQKLCLHFNCLYGHGPLSCTPQRDHVTNDTNTNFFSYKPPAHVRISAFSRARHSQAIFPIVQENRSTPQLLLWRHSRLFDLG